MGFLMVIAGLGFCLGVVVVPVGFLGVVVVPVGCLGVVVVPVGCLGVVVGVVVVPVGCLGVVVVVPGTTSTCNAAACDQRQVKGGEPKKASA